MRVLLIDDDARLAELLVGYLEPQGVSLVHAGGGQAGLGQLAVGGFDAILLDVMMPGMDGLAVLRKIRDAGHRVPVIMLTARGDEADRVVGLELGADDYVAKPFSPRELLARLRAVLRRASPDTVAEKLSAAGITVDTGAREAWVDGKSIELTGLEIDLLVVLLRRAGRVVPRSALLELAGRGDVTINERAVDVHISRLRKKLGDDVLSVSMGSLERRGRWTVPPHLDCRVRFGNIELDLREAELADETTIDARVAFGNLEVIVPQGIRVELAVSSVAGNVEDWRPDSDEPTTKCLRITGKVKFGNVEVIPLRAGETKYDHARRIRHLHHRHRHHHMRELHAERDLWRTHPDRSPWLPWWLQAQMRRRIFSWFAIMFIAGTAAGVHFWGDRHWWYFPIVAIALLFFSGMVSWRLTRPLLLVVKAAREIGDGKFDTRLATRQRGEMRVLANAINDMASRIETQLKDQRQLLAAVSHELRTPLGHMRVLIETARDRHDPKVLQELDREVLVLDDLVGRLLASSRLEFGNLERRMIDLGELVSDVATSAGLAPEQIEAIGDVRAAVDPTLVRRAIANLIDNARVHGGGAVAIRAVRRGGQIAIEVDDHGPGVPADRRADAFRAFVPSSGGGLGLGLALVSRIAVAHDGGAWIDDRPGGGARVGFTLGVGG